MLVNPIRRYAWGSRTALAELQGRAAPAPEPEAELWVGAHPAAPSAVETDAERVPLPDWIARDPARVLGAAVAARFGGELPFLVKILAIERPLSLQAHADAAHARRGFERETAAGLPPDDPGRFYPDPRHKPELVCALGRFRTLAGVREPRDAARRLAALDVPQLGRVVDALRAATGRGDVRHGFAALFSLGPEERRAGVSAAARAAAARAAEDPACAWVVRLAEEHPGDVAALAPLLLELVELAPGEALHLPPGELHCHLEGLAVEVMASSDNVVRGGLTQKRVEPDELLRVARFVPCGAEPLAPRPKAAGARVYPARCAEFELTHFRVGPAAYARVGDSGGAELVLCTAGALVFEPGVAGPRLRAGEAALVPAAAGPQRVAGSGEGFRAAVPE